MELLIERFLACYCSVDMGACPFLYGIYKGQGMGP